MDDDRISIRRATPADRAEMLELCRRSLGWRPDDPSERFFGWKHDENPFGASPAWLAHASDGRLAGVRVFMRWRFVHRGQALSAVRAVDTATDPDFQGRGIFTKLTLGALPELLDEGVDLVFNTPNDKSRPGYLKMGWVALGRVPVAVRVRSPSSMRRMVDARVAASKWSEPTRVGLQASSVMADSDGVERLLRSCAHSRGIATDRTADYLLWRFAFDELKYRAVPLGDRIEDGVVVFRLRRRGTATEMAVCEELVPSGSSSAKAVAWVLRKSGADYALRCGSGSLRAGSISTPRLGPVLTWRQLASGTAPAMGELDLSLGDVELF